MPSAADLQGLMDRMGYSFHDQSLLLCALTHPSYGEPDNQRMEFLGDATLGFLIAETLYRAYPQEQEGALTARRARLVCEAALVAVAVRLDLGRCIRLNKGEEFSRGREKKRVLADAMEALIAAVCLDGGIECARDFVRTLWSDVTLSPDLTKDYKGGLQQHLQAAGEPLPVYEVIMSEGPPHDRIFHSRVTGARGVLAEGSGKSKKIAEQLAAKRALEALTGEDSGS
ncbi:MAG: ribonuclease III [Clostridia bacterium]|nr:ribonuclease III [Clostridia bacterium]